MLMQSWWSGPSTVPWKQPSLPLWLPRSSLASRSAQGHRNFGLLLEPGNRQFPVKGKTGTLSWKVQMDLLFFLLSPEGGLGTLPSHWFSLGLKSEALWVGVYRQEEGRQT